MTDHAYFVKVLGPGLQTIRVPRGYVPQDVDQVTRQLGRLEFVDEPLELLGRVRRVHQQPPVLVVAVVHVQGDDAEPGADGDGVVGAVPGRDYRFRIWLGVTF